MQREITITQSLNADQIANVSTYIFFTSKLKYFFLVVFGIALFNSLTEITNPLNIYKDSEFNFSVLTPFIILITVPLLVWNSLKKLAKKNFSEKTRFYENVNYIIDTVEIKISGDNFINGYQWNELKKIKETKNWFLIYTNDYQAITIEKNKQKTETINQIRELFNSLNIKKSLK